MMGFLHRSVKPPKPRPGAGLRPVCPICERPMERRGSTVWMCPDFPRCPGAIAAD
ncbi:MAG: hypothetical protein ABSC16_10115 [Candidatus Dormibacteria bacterium]